MNEGRSHVRVQPQLRRGFTIAELLVVVGIITVLIAMLLPAVGKAYQSARRSSVKMDLQTIATALGAYKQDFGSYPMMLAHETADGPQTNEPMLARALLGPGPVTDPGTGALIGQDGKDGPGFSVEIGGKAYGPYLPPEKFRAAPKFFTSSGVPKVWFNLLDRFGNPIQYYPKRFDTPALGNGKLLALNKPSHGDKCWFDDRDGDEAPNGGPQADDAVRMLMGDKSLNNIIDGDEVLNDPGPFVLISPGPDGKFYNKGSDPTQYRNLWDNCDDVTFPDRP